MASANVWPARSWRDRPTTNGSVADSLSNVFP
jgi:hypothetical protein